MLVNERKELCHGIFLVGVFVWLFADHADSVSNRTEVLEKCGFVWSEPLFLRMGGADLYSPDALVHHLGVSVWLFDRPLQNAKSQACEVLYCVLGVA